MSRRSQSRRRRSYGRRQHEVRERRPLNRADGVWIGDPEAGSGGAWHSADAGDDQGGSGETFGGYAG